MEIRTRLEILIFHSRTELVEKAVVVELGIEEKLGIEPAAKLR